MILYQDFQTAEQELRQLPEEFLEDKIANDGADAFAKGAKGKAADCQCGQDACICGERLPRKMSRASSSSSLTSGSSYSLPSATPWTVVEPGRLAPGSRCSECSIDAQERGQRAIVLPASSVELGLDPDAIYECCADQGPAARRCLSGTGAQRAAA